MDPENEYIIEKVFLEVNTRSTELAYSLKDNSRSFVEKILFPAIEAVLNEYDDRENVIRIDRLDLNLTVSENEITTRQGELEISVKNNLSRELETLISQSKRRKIEEKESGSDKQIPHSLESVFMFLLENGHLPCYGKKERFLKLMISGDLIKSFDDERFMQELDQLLKGDEKIRARFVNQLSGDIIASYLIRHNPVLKGKEVSLSGLFDEIKPSAGKVLFELFTRMSDKNREEILKEIRFVFAEVASLNDEVKEIEFLNLLRSVLTDNFHKETVLEKLFNREDDKYLTQADLQKRMFPEFESSNKVGDIVSENFFEEGVAEEIFVINAGLILLHPFFKHLFFALGFLNEKEHIINEKIEEAVQTLHYVATGRVDFFEGDMILEKFICDVPLKWPVSSKSLLTEEVKSEVNVMMQEAIKYWAALKNASPDGLRQMFITRDGKLIKQDVGYKLIVERKAQDVLLEKLNWNISIVKLPWKKDLITVEW